MASDDEDDLEALRMLALASMKNKKPDGALNKTQTTHTAQSNLTSSKSLPPSSYSYSHPPFGQHQKSNFSNSQQPYSQYPGPSTGYSVTQVDQYKSNSNYNSSNNFNNRRQQNRGQRQNQSSNTSSNLIVINTIPLEANKKDTGTSDKGHRVHVKGESTKPLLLRPQDKWVSTDEDSQSSIPPRPKGNDKFSRYQSDSNSESDSESSDDDSGDKDNRRKILPLHSDDSDEEQKTNYSSRSRKYSRESLCSDDVKISPNQESVINKVDKKKFHGECKSEPSKNIPSRTCSSSASSSSSSSSSFSSKSDNESDVEVKNNSSILKASTEKSENLIIDAVKVEFRRHVSKLNSELERRIEDLSKSEQNKNLEKPVDCKTVKEDHIRNIPMPASKEQTKKDTKVSSNSKVTTQASKPSLPSKQLETEMKKGVGESQKNVISKPKSDMKKTDEELKQVKNVIRQNSKSKSPVRKFCFKSGSPIRRKSRSRSKSLEKHRDSRSKNRLLRKSRSMSPVRRRKSRSFSPPCRRRISRSPSPRRKKLMPIRRKSKSPPLKRKSKSPPFIKRKTKSPPVVKKESSTSPVLKWAFRSGSPIRRKRSNSDDRKKSRSRSPVRKPLIRGHSRSKSPVIPKKYRLDTVNKRRSPSPLKKRKSRSRSPMSKNHSKDIGKIKGKLSNLKKDKTNDIDVNKKLEARKKKFEAAKEVEADQDVKKISLKGIVDKSKKKKGKELSKCETTKKETNFGEDVRKKKKTLKSGELKKSPVIEKKERKRSPIPLSPKKRRMSSTDKKSVVKKKIIPKKSVDKASDSDSRSDSSISDSESDSDSQTWRNKKSRKSERMKEDIERERRQRLQQEREQNRERPRDFANRHDRNRDNRPGPRQRESRFKQHRNKVFVEMSDDEDNQFSSQRPGRKFDTSSKDDCIRTEVKGRSINKPPHSMSVEDQASKTTGKLRGTRDGSNGPSVSVTCNEYDNPSKKAKLSVHERLGKQHSDDGKILTKSKKFDINDYDYPPSKKPRMDERQRIQSSIGSRVERRRSFDDNNGRMSKSGFECNDLEERIKKIQQKNEAIKRRQHEVMMDKEHFG